MYRRFVVALSGSLFVLLAVVLPLWIVGAVGSGSGSINLNSAGTAATQDFNTLSSMGTANTTLPAGWYLDETGSSASNNGAYRASTGSDNAGDTYSFGAAGSNERAFGTLLSGTLTPRIGGKFINNTGNAITSLTISYTGEMWRAGVASRGAADRLDFQLSTDATALGNGTWTDINDLDFSSPNVSAAAGALNGNSSTNQSAKSHTITGVNIPAGSSFWVRWTDFDISSSDDGLAIDDFSITPFTADQAPEVASTYPVNGATNFPVNGNLSVSFSEPVNVAGSWFTLNCSISGSVTATYSGGPTAFTIDPNVSLVDGETCTFTVLAGQVTDQDGNDPPDNMVANFVVGFSAFDACIAAFTPIYQIQGSGLSAAITGNVATKGVVVGDFEGTDGIGGFYIQDPTGDGDAQTSDAIFVYTGTNNLVSEGDLVWVSGFAHERFNQTTINGSNNNSSAATSVIKCGTGSVTPVDVTLPVATADELERFEGMSVRFPQPLVINEYFEFDRFGEIVLGDTRHFVPTSVVEPGAAANELSQANALGRILLDDGLSIQNPATLRHPNGLPFSTANSFRGGDTLTNVVGVIAYDFGEYRIEPTGPADYTPSNPRPVEPEQVGGRLRVASMNTLNYFLTQSVPGPDGCGPDGSFECRGWNLSGEFERQRAKLLASLSAVNADVFGLNELENTPGVDPLGDPSFGIVPGLNALMGAGTYASIDTGVIGTDTIRVGIIYKPSTVTPVGSPAVLNSPDFVNPFGVATDRNRPAVAQTFMENSTGNRFTIVANHLISKGASSCGPLDPQTGDGQDNCNKTREESVKVLLDWLATDPTGSGDPDFLIIGDLNSYAMEDPIDAIKAGPDDTPGTGDDFVNLISAFVGDTAYSYVFGAEAGYLDHALASSKLAGQVSGATIWHINADEPDVLDYNLDFKPPAQAALYEANQYRSADHDPVIIGLNLNGAPTVDAGGPYSVIEGESINLTAIGSDPDNDALTYEWDLDNDGSYETTGQIVTFSAANLSAPATYTVRVRVTDPFGNSATDTATVNVIYDFTGFFQPINNSPVINTVKAGQAVPIKFSLGGDQGLAIMEAGYPKIVFTPCTAGAPADPVETTLTAGNSGLSYDPASDQYVYVWKTEKSWAGRCGTLNVKLNDGTDHTALFHFTR